VHEPLDQARLDADLAGLGIPVLRVASAVDEKQTYLMRPDLGRSLGDGADTVLAPHALETAPPYDVAFVVTEGLSAGAVQAHAQPVLAAVLPVLAAEGWRIAPLVVVRYGRVAIGDAIAQRLRADCVAVLIGERPGLTATDSLGAYLAWQPGPNTTDADRNCISNIRPEGIVYDDAAFKLVHILRAMRARRLSGIKIKDSSDRLLIGGH